MPQFHVKRCFVAIALDETAREDLAEIRDGLDARGLKPTAEANLHVTVKFLGDVEDPELPGICRALQDVCARYAAFETHVTALQYLPDARRPRVFAARLHRPDTLRELAQAVDAAMAEAGFRREGRPFHPHVTLGRFKSRPAVPLPDLSDLSCPPLTIPVDRLTLVQSTLDRHGPTYSPLASFDLGA